MIVLSKLFQILKNYGALQASKTVNFVGFSETCFSFTLQIDLRLQNIFDSQYWDKICICNGHVDLLHQGKLSYGNVSPIHNHQVLICSYFSTLEIQISFVSFSLYEMGTKLISSQAQQISLRFQNWKLWSPWSRPEKAILHFLRLVVCFVFLFSATDFMLKFFSKLIELHNFWTNLPSLSKFCEKY